MLILKDVRADSIAGAENICDNLLRNNNLLFKILGSL